MVHDQYQRVAELAGDETLAGAVVALVSKAYELSDFLVKCSASMTTARSFPHRVTYRPTCHGLRGMKLGDAPLRLLRNVRNIDLVELPEAETCCGFGGTFAVKNADTSTAMLTDKLHAVQGTGAEVVACDSSACSNIAAR